ncbi:MAG: hypothetical protein M1833_000925 [Piccolia ochrophora]|nr:MAG: hypothetical protein M1833_000925 [Piccolia ochrophora]
MSLPTLTTHRTTTPTSLTTAHHLLASSIAQQRQLAAYTLITHPLSLSLYMLLLATLYACLPHLAVFFTTGAGVTMALLVGVRVAVAGYIEEAERVGRDRAGWVGGAVSGGGSGGEDGVDVEMEQVVVVAEWDDRVVGVVVVGVDTRERKGVVRAWTVALRMRGLGVGREVLREAVKVVREKCGEKGGEGGAGVRVVFDERHANSLRVLPAMFNDVFERQDRKARRVLESVQAELDKEMASERKEKSSR